MSATGVCPHCGKTFKRLNSHLPRCKARALSEPSASQQRAAASEDTMSTPPSSPPTTSSSAKTRKSVSPSKESPMKTVLKTKKDKESRLSALPESTPSKSRSESLSPPASASSKRNPPGPPGQTQTLTSSVSPSAPSPSPPQPVNPAPSGGKQTTSQHTTNGALKSESRPRSASSDPLPTAPHPLRCPSSEQGAGAELASSSAPEAEVPSKAEMRGRSPLTCGPSADGIPLGGVLGTAETPGRSVNAIGVQSVNGAHARASLQSLSDVSGRSKVSAGRVKPGSLAQHLIQTSLLPRHPAPGETQAGDVVGVQTPLRYANGTGTCRERPALPASLARAAALVGSSSLTQPSSSLPCPLTPSGEQDSLRGRMPTKDPEVDMRNLKLMNAIEGNLAGRRLGQVCLGELPLWLALHAPSRPRAALEALRGGWWWYRRRYVDVKRGGLGGFGMLLAGYCVLGYAWSYPQRKSDRWRKFH